MKFPELKKPWALGASRTWDRKLVVCILHSVLCTLPFVETFVSSGSVNQSTLMTPTELTLLELTLLQQSSLSRVDVISCIYTVVVNRCLKNLTDKQTRILSS